MKLRFLKKKDGTKILQVNEYPITPSEWKDIEMVEEYDIEEEVFRVLDIASNQKVKNFRIALNRKNFEELFNKHCIRICSSSDTYFTFVGKGVISLDSVKVNTVALLVEV